MKKTSLIFGVIALTGSIFFSSCDSLQPKAEGDKAETKAAAGKGSIVYVDMDRILDEYDMANDLTSVVNTKAAAVEQDLTRRSNKLERDVKDFQKKIDQGLLTRSVAEVQSQKLQEQQANLQNYAAQKQQEVQEEMVVTQNQILNAISTFIKTYNEDKGYAMILTTQGDNLSVPVVCADEALDITDDIVEGLNKEYLKTKNNPADSKAEEAKAEEKK